MGGRTIGSCMFGREVIGITGGTYEETQIYHNGRLLPSTQRFIRKQWGWARAAAEYAQPRCPRQSVSSSQGVVLNRRPMTSRMREEARGKRRRSEDSAPATPPAQMDRTDDGSLRENT
eukprot:1577154-Pyramimonas_sp.AAC.1